MKSVLVMNKSRSDQHCHSHLSDGYVKLGEGGSATFILLPKESNLDLQDSTPVFYKKVGNKWA